MKLPYKLTITKETWPLAKPFVISRGTRTETDVVVVTICDGKHTGYGECVPTPRYGESIASVIAAIECIREKVEQNYCLEKLQQWLPAGAARNAIDCALWDLLSKQKQTNVSKLVGFIDPKALTTVQTISIDTPDNMGKSAHELRDFPQLKIKLNEQLIVERLNAIHKNAPQAKLLIDANESWSPDILNNTLPLIKHLPIVMIEQPLKAGEDGALEGLTFTFPLGADESCHTCEDIPYLASRYDIINIKLDKCGGLSEGIKLAKLAKENGLEVMVGCMLGTSLSMAPGLVLATQAKYIDLDAPLLIKEDRPYGLQINKGTINGLNPKLWGSG